MFINKTRNVLVIGFKHCLIFQQRKEIFLQEDKIKFSTFAEELRKSLIRIKQIVFFGEPGFFGAWFQETQKLEIGHYDSPSIYRILNRQSGY